METTHHPAPPDGDAASASLIPGQKHYESRYLGPRGERLYSYQQQVEYALATRPARVLLVGKGDGLIAQILDKSGAAVTTLDIEPELRPDIVASVESIPLQDAAVDVSLCCQVLEHLPFEQFRPVLEELRRVTRTHLVLSLPDVRRFASLRLSFPKVKVDVQCSLPRLRARTIPAERLTRHGHFWEIGFAGTGFARVRDTILQSGWHIQELRRVADLSWHTFFYLRRERVVG